MTRLSSRGLVARGRQQERVNHTTVHPMTKEIPSTASAQRSTRADVRNPMLGDPAVMAEWQALRADHPQAADALVQMLRRLSKRWRGLADHSWAKHKAPLAAYHKANAVNARHLAIAGTAQPVPRDS